MVIPASTRCQKAIQHPRCEQRGDQTESQLAPSSAHSTSTSWRVYFCNTIQLNHEHSQYNYLATMVLHKTNYTFFCVVAVQIILEIKRFITRWLVCDVLWVQLELFDTVFLPETINSHQCVTFWQYILTPIRLWQNLCLFVSARHCNSSYCKQFFAFWIH